MNRSLLFTCLVIVVMIAASGCGGAPAATAAPAATDLPDTEPAVPSEAPAATEAATEVPTEAATEAPTTESQPLGGALEFTDGPNVPREKKPLLEFSTDTVTFLQTSEPVKVTDVVQESIAYTLPPVSGGAETATPDPNKPPDWPVAIRVASFTQIELKQSPELTSVGLIEMGPQSNPDIIAPGIYEVQIDLDSGSGRLTPITASSEYEVAFQRIPQEINPERLENAPYKEFQNPPLDNTAAISADGVCFVIRMDAETPYIRFCSEPGSVLSVSKNFTSQYEGLQASMSAVAERFGLQNDIQLDQIISTMEHPGHITACSRVLQTHRQNPQALTQVCSSDVSVAPVTEGYFTEKFEAAKSQPTEGRFSVPVAAVQVYQSIPVTKGNLQPGEYQMDYWFEVKDGEAVFYAATVSGVAILSQGQEQEVQNQQVPAVPATFINADGTPQPGAQISACKIFGKCTFFQNSCS